MKIYNKIVQNKKEVAIVVALIVVSALAHGINMFSFPYYENDEGNYMAQAWSLIKFGELAPYTYWYDHAPGGWILIAIWTLLTGGFFTFGPSVNSGRVLMLVLHIAISICLYFVAKKISGRKAVGILSVLIFSFSPLGVYYQRRVLLDNIMTFWVFAAVALVVNKSLKLSRVIISAAFFAFAVLSKENAIFFYPLFLYLIFTNSSHNNRRFLLPSFIVVSASLISTYFLYAILKNEFFPVGFMGNDQEHVSLLQTLIWHNSRGADLPFWKRGSDFYGSYFEWLNKDPYIVILGLTALGMATILSIFKKSFRAPVIFGLLFIFFLVRGGLIIGFYIVPMIPIFALIIAIVYNYFAESLSFGRDKLYKGISVVGFVAIPAVLLTHHNGQFTRSETAPQYEALVWVKENVPEDAYIVIDNYMYVDLKEEGFVNDKVFPNADWFWKIYYDPEIREEKYGDDFRKIEYVTLSHEMLRQIGEGTQDYLKDTLSDSEEIVTWTQETTSFLDFDNYNSTNGDWMSIFKRKEFDEIFLSDSWDNYKKNYLVSYGQIVDPASDRTTSEGQSYAMLRAVWRNDKETFDGVWKWTKDHMQHRDDKLLSWVWGRENGKEGILDANTASDADIDIALSLIFAYKSWGDEQYQMDARQIINDIWEHEVVDVSGRYLLTASADSVRENGFLVNPSYFSPASYRIFENIDNSHEWRKLADDSYFFLELIAREMNAIHNIPPNWVVIDEDQNVTSANPYVDGNPDEYGYDAFRTYWRVVLDYKWFGSLDAFRYLKSAEPFFENEWTTNGYFYSVYALNGSNLTDYSDIAVVSAPLSVFVVTNPEIAREIYEKEYAKFVSTDCCEELNYYNQNWVWFATALYTDNLPNLWNGVKNAGN